MAFPNYQDDATKQQQLDDVALDEKTSGALIDFESVKRQNPRKRYPCHSGKYKNTGSQPGKVLLNDGRKVRVPKMAECRPSTLTGCKTSPQVGLCQEVPAMIQGITYVTDCICQPVQPTTSTS
jgi:hypothetical protein